MASPKHACRCKHQKTSLGALRIPTLFLSMILPRSSYAQIISEDAAASTTTPQPRASFTRSTLSTIATSSTLSEIIQTPRPTMTSWPNPNGSTAEDHGSSAEELANKQHQGILNYYFVFLALLAIIIAVGIYVLTKRRRRRKLENRNTGTSALARDLSGWSNSRRWINGTRAMRTGNTGVRRREDGLNEDGEAPPPYMPKSEPPPIGQDSGEHGDRVNGLSIPLRALTGEGRAVAKPPDYEETLRTPNESITDVSRPATAATRGGESSRGILPN